MMAIGGSSASAAPGAIDFRARPCDQNKTARQHGLRADDDCRKEGKKPRMGVNSALLLDSMACRRYLRRGLAAFRRHL